MANDNRKAYRVTLVGGNTPRVIEANEAVEDAGRLKFLGNVAGHSAYSGDVVASFLSSQVIEYGVIPVPEEEKTGAYTYTVSLGATLGTKTVQADSVLYTRGGEGTPGQFTFVTNLRTGAHRTEFLIGEDKVEYVIRVTDTGDTRQVVPGQLTGTPVSTEDASV